MNYMAEILLPKQHSKEQMWERTIFLERIGDKLKLYITGYRLSKKMESQGHFISRNFGNAHFVFFDIKKCMNKKYANECKARISRELEKKFNNLNLLGK